jgi:REP element-mobilizing transposase RayT
VLARLDRETLRQRLRPYDIQLLELTTNPLDARALVSLQSTESVSAAARKMKGRVSKWLGEQAPSDRPTKTTLARGYFAVTTGQSTAEAIDAYLQRQGEHHGYSNRPRLPVYIQSFKRTPAMEQILRTEHAQTLLRFHVVLATWRRLGVFVPSSSEMVCDHWRSLQSDLRFVIDKVSFLPDHVHVAVALHPSVSPAGVAIGMMNAAQELMWTRFDDLVVRAGVERLWQPSAYIGSFVRPPVEWLASLPT